MIDKATADEWYQKIIPEMEKRNMTLEHIMNYMMFEDECVEHGFTFKSLLEARKRVEPKKVLEGEVGKSTYYACRVCGNILNTDKNYCDFCGQKLDWRVEK